MVATVASFGSFSPVQGRAAHAVPPAAAAPLVGGPPRRDAVPHVVSAVAFAPAAMSALIEAQERLSDAAPVLSREHTVQKIDQLISRLDGASAPGAAPFSVRRLEAARQALARSPVDLHA